MKTKAQTAAIIAALKELYPDAACSLDYGKDYELLFSVRLAAQCTDARVNLVTPALFARYPTLEDFARADVDEVGTYVQSCGFWRAKARDIVSSAQQLLERFGGRVPDTMDDLLSLPGVGRKTANVVYAVGFGGQAIAVDTHVFRVANRLGLAHAKNVLDTEKQLCQAIDKELWSDSHHYLLLHGRYVCKSQRPDCARCRLKALCEYFQSGCLEKSKEKN